MERVAAPASTTWILGNMIGWKRNASSLSLLEE
nr:MAG TPA: hypothetical protein [Caudoviricetes sp.]